MRNRALIGTFVGLLTLAACSRSTRTVVVEPSPAREPRRVTPPPPPPPPAVAQRPTTPGPSTAATLGIPPGHLPDAGECRIWIPGTPPGQQPGAKSRPCAGIAAAAPAGSWIVYRPTRDKKLVHVRVVDTRRAGFVTIVRIFDIDSGRLLRDLRPEEEPVDAPEDRRGNNGRPNNDRPANDRPTYEQPQDRGNQGQGQGQGQGQPSNPPPPPPTHRPSDGGEATMKLDIPRGQLPDVGECRVWLPASPPGQQPRPKSRSCDGISNSAPAGSWVLYRPAGDARVVHVLVIDARRAGAVIRTRVFDIETNQLVREENP